MDILQNDKPRASLQKRLSLDYWSRVILLLYIFTMPFVSAFAFSGTISWPLIFAVFLFLIMVMKIIRYKTLPSGFLGFDLLIIFPFLFIVIFSFFINGWGNSKSLNHTIAYLSTFLLFFVAIKFCFLSAPDKRLVVKQTLLFITYTTIVSALYGNVEFISANAFGVNLNDYIPRPSEVEKLYNPTVLALFYRIRGFATESGVYTQMLELFSPLAIYFMYFSGQCKWPTAIKLFIVFSIMLSIIFAASSATFIILPVAVGLSSFLYIKKVLRFFSNKSLAYYLKTTLILSLILIINSYLSIYTSIWLSVLEKLDSDSLYDRHDKINFFFNQFSKFSPINKLIGAGPAGSDILGFTDSGTVISLYYNVTFELGIIGLSLLLCLMGYLILCNFFIKSKIGFFLMVSLISGIIHYYVVNNYYVPWFWFIGAFIVFYNKTQLR